MLGTAHIFLELEIQDIYRMFQKFSGQVCYEKQKRIGQLVT
jgi:hypothetical protein